MIRRVLLVVTALVLVAAVGVGAVAFRRPVPGEPVEVMVSPGQTTHSIARTLEQERVIGSTLGFRVMARLRGLDGTIQAGRYELRQGMGVHAALDVLSRRPIEVAVRVTIPEGFTVRQVAERLEARTHLSADEILEAAQRVRASVQPPEVPSLEGLLFPDTYVVGEHDGAEEVVGRMVAEFEARTAELDWSVAEQRGLSRYDAIIVASLIEREARVPEDRDKISAVIYNRLDRGMRLQIDITALYGLDEHKVPTRRDLQRDSPYNTYLVDGLPPTPIANPGFESIRAALAPAAIDAIFYVVIDPSGKHGFTADAAEFERLKRLRPPEVRGG